jgi:hypothetical protein
MSNKDLFKEAIADAKAVREAALANAKVALEEALAPKLQSMLSAKLQEMDMDMDDENLEEVDYSSDNYSKDDQWHVKSHERSQSGAIGEGDDAELEEDFDLSEILAELSDDEDKKMNEAEEEDEDEAEDEEMEDEEDESEMEDEEAEDESEMEGESITDLTMDELKDIIKDIISSEMGGDEMDADMGDMGGEEEMSMDLGGEEGDDEVAMEEEIDEIDLEELLAELDALGESDDEKEMYEAKKKKEDEKDDMKEAIDTIEALRNELNEVNLLNAKLLYVNKVFKAKNLNESQKLKVIAQFDKATTAKEAKAIFESMNSAIAKSKKSTIKESLGFASKAAGVAPKKQIVQVDETMSRWQMLAGITKY